MSRNLRRSAVLGLSLVVAVPSVAVAAVDEHAVEADTRAVTLSVFDDVVGDLALDLVGTDVLGSSDPMASATVSALSVLGQTITEEVVASSERDRVTRPSEGDGCMVPAAVTGLTVSAACATATARAGPPDTPANQDAAAVASLANIAVSGSFVSGVLTTELDALLTGLTDALGDQQVADAIGQFTAACNELLANAPAPPPEAPATASELIGMTGVELDDALDALTDLDPDGFCTAVLNLTVEDLTEDVVDLAPLTDALDGVDLIELDLDGARSEIVGEETSLTAAADQVFVSISGPSLGFLDDVLDEVVQGALDTIILEIETIAGVELPEAPDLTDELADTLGELPIFGLDEPLLTAVTSGGTATALLDLETGVVSASGEQPFVTVSIAGGVAELFGVDPSTTTVTVSAGQSMTIAEGTPLQSDISVGEVVVSDDQTLDGTDLRGSTAATSASTVALLTGIEGGVELVLGASNAGAYGAEFTASSEPPAPAPELPRTGGGAALGAVLALGAGYTLLRRRRD